MQNQIAQGGQNKLSISSFLSGLIATIIIYYTNPLSSDDPGRLYIFLFVLLGALAIFLGSLAVKSGVRLLPLVGVVLGILVLFTFFTVYMPSYSEFGWSESLF